MPNRGLDGYPFFFIFCWTNPHQDDLISAMEDLRILSYGDQNSVNIASFHPLTKGETHAREVLDRFHCAARLRPSPSFLLIFRQILNPFGVKALCKAKCYPNS